jgi:hypothetical protein
MGMGHGNILYYFLSRPLSLLLISLIILSIAGTAYRRHRSRLGQEATPEADMHIVRKRAQRDIYTGIGVMLFSFVAFLPLRGGSWEYAAWPGTMLAVLGLLSVILIIGGVQTLARSPQEGVQPAAVGGGSRPPYDPSDQHLSDGRYKTAIGMAVAIVLTAFYTAGSYLVGFYEATFAFMIVMPIILGRQNMRGTSWWRWLQPIPVAFLFTLSLYAAFEWFLRVLIPSTLLR